MQTAFIGLGANQADPRAQVLAALAELDALPDTRVVARSSLYRSEPLGYTAQPDFVNAVARLDTGLAPRALLAGMQSIEQRHGRERSFRNAPRTLDLDLLLYDALELDEPDLRVPHPRMHERAFVLQPLAEIAPEAEVPGRGTASALLARCPGQRVERMSD
jgi:2-amino-4-hydroxy-6-hydroxymethyldihydropteridine diphosphokinase